MEIENIKSVLRYPYDSIWGVGLSENDERITDPSKWLGTNWLGHAIMCVRRSLANEINGR